jgi:hypothetical protein
LTGHDRQCTYNAQPKSGRAVSPQTFNGNYSNYSSVDVSVTGAANLNGPKSISISTEFQPGPETETLFDIQRRLKKLEHLCATHSYTPIKTSNREDDAQKSNKSLPKADAT